MERIQVGNVRSDCTAFYKIILDKDTTVKSFINNVLKSFPREWGYITIDVGKDFSENIRVKYRNGKILDRNFSIPNENQLIKNVDADGGWSNMDYVIKLI